MSATSALQATPAAPIAVREGGWGGALLTPRRSNILLALLLCGILPTVTARAMPDLFNGSQALLLTTATATVAAAIALNILMGYAGQISLGHAALLGVGAFTSGLLTSNAGIPLGFTTIPGGQSMLIGIPAAAITGALVALVIGFPALRLRGLYLAIVTIGFGYAVEQSIFRMPALTRGSAGIELPRRMFARPVASGLTGFFHDRLHLGFSIPASLDLNADFLAFALLVVVIIWVVDENILRSRLGRAFHGIREDEAVAQSFAIDVSRYKLLAFVISGAVAGVAGALYGHAVLFTNNEQWTLVGPTLLSSSEASVAAWRS